MHSSTLNPLYDEISIIVADSGAGMTSEQLKHLFEKFSQFETYQLNQKSTGLGLYLTHHFINMHNGNISVESERGQGSKFTVTLPKIYQAKPNTQSLASK